MTIIGEQAKTTGFASPAADYLDRQLDLHQLLIKNPAATFFVRVRGKRILAGRAEGGFAAGGFADGIADGNILVVDRALKPIHGQLVIAAIDGRMVLRRLIWRSQYFSLVVDRQLQQNLWDDDDGMAGDGSSCDDYHAYEPSFFDASPDQEGRLLIWGVVTAIIQHVD